MGQYTKVNDSAITSSPFQMPADGYPVINPHPGAISYQNELTNVWRHGTDDGLVVVLDANDGSGCRIVIDKAENPYPLPDNPFPSTGLDFLGWSYSKDGEVIEEKAVPLTRNTTFFAIWGRTRDYYLAFNACGGENAPETIIKKKSEVVTLPSEIPTLQDNTFLGWSLDRNGEPDYQPGDTFSLSGDYTLFAVWQHVGYSVSFKPNGGSGSMSTVRNIYGDYILPPPKFKAPSGKIFLGWSRSQIAADIISAKTIFVEKTITLYALWIKADYRILYDSDIGAMDPDYQAKNAGESVVLLGPPTHKEYKFLGWCSNDSGVPDYQPGDVYSKNADLFLKAIWDEPTFLIEYDGNGGTNVPPAQNKRRKEPLTLSTVIPVKEGYDFFGWGFSPSKMIVEYTPGDLYLEDASVKLYAVWISKGGSLYVYYNANGGTGYMEPTPVEPGIFVLPPCEFEPIPSTTFQGWVLEPTSEDNVTEIEITDHDVTVYANWSDRAKYTIVYDANGGEGAPDPQVKEHGIPITLSNVEPTRERYDFKGWSSSPTGSVKYLPGDEYVEDKNIYLYAVWEEHLYTLTFDANGGTRTMEPVQFNYGSHKIPGSRFLPPSGKYFAGWSASPTDINLITDIFMDEDKTVYAIWTADNTFLITFDLNGVEEEEKNFPPQTKQLNKTLKLHSRKPLKEGYNFQGWALDPNGPPKYLYGDNFKLNQNCVLYAIWKKVIYYVVTFHNNGGEGYMEPIVDAKDVFNPPASTFDPPYEGCYFAGWAFTPTGKVQPTPYRVTSNLELYAVWYEE